MRLLIFLLEPNLPKKSPLPSIPNAKPTISNCQKQQVQTPQQRRANEAYAKSEAAKRGKPQTEVERIMERKKASKLGAQNKSPVSKVWLCKFCPRFSYRSFYMLSFGRVGIGIGRR